MNMKQVRKKAATMGLKVGNMKKADLIRTIQIEEGNTPCFQGMNSSCDQKDCCWKSDCLPVSSN